MFQTFFNINVTIVCGVFFITASQNVKNAVEECSFLKRKEKYKHFEMKFDSVIDFKKKAVFD